MLTFKQKQAIIDQCPELVKKEISLKRLNYHFDGSLYEKTVVVEKLHPNGNGFVFVGDLLKYESIASDKGLVNIRDFSAEALKEIVEDAIAYLSEEIVDEPIIELWRSRDGLELELRFEEPVWNIYHKGNLEDTFGTREDAASYLHEESFRFAKQISPAE